MNLTKLRLGMEVRFDPFSDRHDGERMNGNVVLIHEEHTYFTVEYKLGGQSCRTCFKFGDYYGPKNKKVFAI